MKTLSSLAHRFGGLLPASPRARQRPARALLGTLAAGALLSACGGGVSSSRDGVDSGGSGTCVAALSTYSGTLGGGAPAGAIALADVRFALAYPQVADCRVHAQVLDELDGQTLADTQLLPGAQAVVLAWTVQAGPDGTLRANAANVSLVDDLAGPVDSVDPDQGRLQLLGQTVRVDAATVWAGPANLGAILPGQTLRVHGLVNADTGEHLATRIETLDTAASVWSLTGPVTALDLAQDRLTVGGARLDLSGVPAASRPTLAVGDVVNLHLAAGPLASPWLAQTLTRQPASPMPDSLPLDDHTVQGLVAGMSAGTRWRLGNLWVDTQGASVTDARGLAATVQAGDQVRAHGRTEAGLMHADRVVVITP